MKTNFNNSWRKTVFFAFLILTSATLYNCSNDDDNPGPDPIDPEVVQGEFDEIVIPELVDDEPEVTEPDVSAEASTPEATTTAAADFSAATSAGDLSAESNAILADLETAAASMPASAISTASTLTQEQIAAMLDVNTELPDDIDPDAIMAALPAELVALMPQITYDFGTSASAGVSEESIGVLNAGVQLDPIGQAVDAPCEDVYNDIYDDAIARLQGVQAEQLEAIANNFASRMAAASGRLTTRTEALDTDAAAFADEFEALSVQFLLAAEDLDFAEDDLRLMAFLIALEGRIQIQSWYDAASTVLEAALATEEAAIEAQEESATSTVEANYATAAADARELLNEGLANCHNQGAGS